jgi:hypothetical protein
MKIPSKEWLAIVEYRDFYDVPRLILASSSSTSFWIFDSGFEDDNDEYSSEYLVCFAGHEIGEAKRKFKQYAEDANSRECVDLRASALMRLPVSGVRFDPSKRKKLLIELSSGK